MLCPLRKIVKSATFVECYREECEWWIDDEPDFEGHCTLHSFGKLAINEWKKRVFPED